MPPRKTSNRVTSKDVARLAGVSQSAVSRTFTPGASVSESTRERVLQASNQLGYRPNVIARSLSQQSTRLIGIVMVKIADPFYARLLEAFSIKLQDRGYWSLLLDVHQEFELEEALPQAMQYQVDGIVITSATLSSRMASVCANLGVPVVLFNRFSLNVEVNAVSCDHAGGGRRLGDLLLQAGHKRIAYIAGEEKSSTNQERERGFVEILKENGQDLWGRGGGDYSYESGYAAAGELIRGRERPDAIFCANDLMAMGAFDKARDLGFLVPEDISIVGFDDIPMASWPRYSLTTIKQPVERLVDATVEVLIDAIQSPAIERVIKMIPGTLVERTSARLP